MEYKIVINEFEGPLDLLLHLIKESKMEITEIRIDEITKQYLNYIETMEKMNLDITSEYLIMAAELIEIKSRSLLPNKKVDEDEFEEDPKENLIKRLLEYKRYKEMSNLFEDLELSRNQFYTKKPEDLRFYQEPETIQEEYDINLLIDALNNFFKRKQKEKPLNTKITKKEYSVSKRNVEIKNILLKKKQVNFEDLFDIYKKDYVVVTFLSILDLLKKQEINVNQDTNFGSIVISIREK